MDLKEVILTDVLSQSTEFKPETYVEEKVEEVIEQTTPLKPESSNQTNKSPEASADAIVDMLNLVNKSVFVPLMTYKAKKKLPKHIIKIMEDAVLKEFTGETLTDAEKKAIKAFNMLNKKIETIKKEVPFSKDEQADLKPATLAIVNQFGWEITGAVWFGVKVFEMYSKRVIDAFVE